MRTKQQAEAMRRPGPGDVIETEDGYRFTVLENGSITDGDMSWDSFAQFQAALADDPQGPIRWTIMPLHRTTRGVAGGRRHQHG